MKKMMMMAVALVLMFTVIGMNPGKTEAATPKVTVTTKVLNVRDKASTYGKRVGQVRKGQVFNYRGKVGAWIKIGYGKHTRYVHGSYVRVTSPGVKPTPLAKAAAAPVGKSSYKVKMNTSAYTPYCVGCSGITASGKNVKSTQTHNGYKIVAAPPQYKFGTRMYIPGFGNAIVLDRGGAIKGNKLDLLVKTKSQAYAWGRKNVTVTVYR